MEEQVVNATTLVNFDERFFDQKTVDEKFSTNSLFDEKSFDQRHPIQFYTILCFLQLFFYLMELNVYDP